MNLASRVSGRRNWSFVIKQRNIHQVNTTMKLRYTALAVTLANSSAWMYRPLPKVLNSAGRINDGPSSLSLRLMSGIATQLGTTVAPEEFDIAYSPLKPDGKPISEGTVVSVFKGGLFAVRIDDDFSEDDDTPEVVDTTNLLPQPTKKSMSSTSLGGDLMGHQVVFASDQVGVVVSHRPPLAFVYTDMDNVDNIEGTVTVLDKLASVAVNDEIKAIDCFGRPFEQSATEETRKRAIFSPIPQVKDIALINSPLITGVTMFDALSPIGKGQNMLMVGSDIDDMRGYVCDFLSLQSKETKCVYAATDGKKQVKKLLQDAGVLDDVIVVSEHSKEGVDKVSKAAEATVVAATACAVAESFALEQGKDTLVIIDNIDQHKKLWDATTRVLVDVFGVEAVVKGDRDGGASSEMRAFFSSLVQRSAQFKKKLGGGSVTILLLTTIPKLSAEEDAIYSPEDFEGSPDKVKDRLDLLVKRNVPLTAANLRKIQIPIPSTSEGLRRISLQHVDDLISMSDGQIWLDEELKESGRRPAMDFQRSLTRIGIGADTKSRADAAAVRRVVEGLRLDLSQAEYMDGADVETKASVKQLENARAWLLAMHQPPGSGGRLLSESCAILLAASKGYLGDSVNEGKVAGTGEGETLIRDLLEHVKAEAASAMEEIDSTQDLESSSRDDIETAFKSFFA